MFQHRLQRLSAEDLATSVTRDTWGIPFLGLLGYEPHYNPRAFEVDGLTFAISHRAGEPEDASPLHIVGVRQELGRVAASGRPRLAPHSLVQEYLNRTEHLWGIVTNGLTLRLLRDSTFVRRQAYVEFDLTAIFEESRFQDFAALYRLLHRTRLPRGLVDAGGCLLEQYYAHSVEQGGRIREHLRDGVEECIKSLVSGFLRHRANDELRRCVSSACPDNERISAEDLYRQLLRLVYRLLFLLVSEDRGLLSPNPIYREHYGIARLRRLLENRAASTEHDDLWQSLRVLWKVLSDEQLAAFLKLAPLNGELFTPQDLDAFTITNHDLLDAFWHLAWYQEHSKSPPRRVNYAALDVEELGSVYESLLEFHPAIDVDAAGRPEFKLIFGSERKTTGSYYTPPELVNELMKSALDPVIHDRLAARPHEPEMALLSIRVCDPACGSGHFLLAAARRIGKELARLRTGEDEAAPERAREATRDVISHCVYGVDKNPLAVDLCRVALWLESHTGDKPLTFLDHRIRCGDSLVGVFDLEALKDGIPDKAFEPLEGDDRATARALARLNREERAGEMNLFPWNASDTLADLIHRSRTIDAIADDTPEAIRRKKQLFEQSHTDPAWRRQKDACDLWCAAFFQALKPETPTITSSALADYLDGRPLDPRLLAQAWTWSVRQGFFHWPLEFPEIFADGGFDVILSNPPWERVKLQEQEFFAVHDARIANAPTKAARARLIKELPQTDPELHRKFVEALRAAAAASLVMRHSGRFPLTGRGDINTYAVFAELAASATKPNGHAGLILPRGIATDDTTKLFFGSMVRTGRLVQLVGFENEEFIFPAVDHRVTFCTLTLGGGGKPVMSSRIAFYIRRFSQLSEEHRFFSLEDQDFWLLNPNTGNCPIFRTEADAELTKAIYRRVPVLWREAADGQPEVNAWRLSFKTLFHMANDSHHFRTAQELESDGYRREGNVFVSPYDRYLPLYEAKMMHQFDHRFSTYEGATEKQLNVGILPQPSTEQKCDPAFVVQPRYWVREEIVESAIPKYPEPLAIALQVEHAPSIQYVMALWAAGFHLHRSDKHQAAKLLEAAIPSELDRAVVRALGLGTDEDHAKRLAQDFPLTEDDVHAIAECLDAPEPLARDLVERFSPKWFLGWRDICRPTDERTLIASVVPRVAVGNKIPLYGSTLPSSLQLCLLAILNSFVCDFCARQKVGGTTFNFFIMKQVAVLHPSMFYNTLSFPASPFLSWLAPRVLELTCTANDLTPLAHDCGYDGPPFSWDDERRFEIRCELDAAFFHVYLPCEPEGSWRKAEGETAEQLAALKRHIPKPRDAVAYILDQFPIVRQKDEQVHGRYRTKERILEIYDAMLAAQHRSQPYLTKLNPPPGNR